MVGARRLDCRQFEDSVGRKASARALRTVYADPVTKALTAGARAAWSGDDVRRQLILDKAQAVAQNQLALLQPLDLQLIASAEMEQRLDRGVEIAMFLAQMFKLSLQRSALPLGHLFRHDFNTFERRNAGEFYEASKCGNFLAS